MMVAAGGWLLLLLTGLHSGFSEAVDADCPQECVCMWKSGKETTECINRDRSVIPPGIAPSTQVLDLRGNNLRVLHNNVFLQLGITNLQRIYCPYCGIVEVEPRAFRRLTNLVELDLSENAMREVPSEAWRHTKALMKLNLSGNPIKLIRSGAFSRLRFVTTLALSHCDIETLEDGAFEGMDALSEVKLESNKLQLLQGSGLFPSSLHHIEMHDNPFRCDCRLLDFTHWLQRSGVPRPVEPLCKTPTRLENRSLSSLDLEELACLPQVEPPFLVSEASEGQNVTLRCSVFGLPTASVSWWHSNRLVANGSNLQHAWEDQYYSIAEYRTNAHQLVSELVILSIRGEDDGSFFCSAQNPAGVARGNFTVRVVDSVFEAVEAGGTSGGLQENTRAKNTEETDMFKVEYILGFGAAAVIVLTIIIVLILYLILQCRSDRRKRRSARAAGLACDSNSGSYMERSTVDFIVPGEMELTSAVRSVSCNSTINKCNGASLLNSKDKDRDGCGSGNDGDDEEEYGNHSMSAGKVYGVRPVARGDGWPASQPNGFVPSSMYGQIRPAGPPPSYRHPPPYNSSGDKLLCPCCGEPQQHHNQQQPQWNMPHHHPRQMVEYPPHAFGQPDYGPAASQQVVAVPMHLKECPRMTLKQFRPGTGGIIVNANGYLNEFGQQYPATMQQHHFVSQASPQTQDFNFQSRPPIFVQQPFRQPEPGTWAGPAPTMGILRNVARPPQTQMWREDNNVSRQSSAGDTEDIRYGPYSDGEADRSNAARRPSRSRSLPRRPSSSLMYPNQQQQQQQQQPAGIPGMPHYVTLSRAAMMEAAGDPQNGTSFQRVQQFEQHSIRFQPPPPSRVVGGPPTPGQRSSSSLAGRRDDLKYNSQPHLNGSAVLDFPPTSSKAKPPVPPFKPQLSLKGNRGGGVGGEAPRYKQPVSQQSGSIEDSEYLFPDLPPPPDAMLDTIQPRKPPHPLIRTQQQSFDAQSDSQNGGQQDFQNSRSSSLDDLQWVTSAAEMPRQLYRPQVPNVMPPGFHRAGSTRSHTLPANGSYPPRYSLPMPPHPRNEGAHLTVNGVVVKPRDPSPSYDSTRRGSGAVKIDLSSADKTIRRPGSAPDLAVKNESARSSNSPMRSALRHQEDQRGASLERQLQGRPVSHPPQATGTTSSNSASKKVMFSGVSDGESPSESQGEADDDNDVWVLRDEDSSKKAPDELEDNIPVTGVVVAQPQPCQYMLARIEAQKAAASQKALMPTVFAKPGLVPSIPTATVPVRPPAPPPPPRTTPISTGATVSTGGGGGTMSLAGGAGRPPVPNPALQRPALQQFHESPDEGYHEDDAGSEVL